MPYADESSGLAAIQALADSDDLGDFRARLQPPSPDTVLNLPPFRPSLGRPFANSLSSHRRFPSIRPLPW